MALCKELLATLLVVQPGVRLASWAAPVEIVTHQGSAPNPPSAQPVFVLGIAPVCLQGLACGLVVHPGLPLKPVKVPLDGIPSLQRASGKL